MSWISWMLPHGASTFVGDVDGIYYLILAITGVAFVIVEIGLVWFLIKYRARPGRPVRYTHGNNTAEVIWTSIVAVTVVVLGLLSAPVWKRIKGRDSVPADAMVIRVHVKQFEWNFIYPGPDGRFDTPGSVGWNHARICMPGTASCLMRKAGMLKEWMTSSDVSSTTTGRFTGRWSWFRRVKSSGVSNLPSGPG